MECYFVEWAQSVKENIKSELQSYGIKYKEESTGIFQGSTKYERYSKLYSASTYSSAISGVELKVFRVRFRNSFNFKAGASWDDEFRNEFQLLLESQNKDQAIDFYKEYGTHYIREAEIGGRKESLLGVSYCDLEEDEKKKAEFEAKLLTFDFALFIVFHHLFTIGTTWASLTVKQSSRVLPQHAEEEILSTLTCVLTIPDGTPQF